MAYAVTSHTLGEQTVFNTKMDTHLGESNGMEFAFLSVDGSTLFAYTNTGAVRRFTATAGTRKHLKNATVEDAPLAVNDHNSVLTGFLKFAEFQAIAKKSYQASCKLYKSLKDGDAFSMLPLYGKEGGVFQDVTKNTMIPSKRAYGWCHSKTDRRSVSSFMAPMLDTLLFSASDAETIKADIENKAAEEELTIEEYIGASFMINAEVLRLKQLLGKRAKVSLYSYVTREATLTIGKITLVFSVNSLDMVDLIIKNGEQFSEKCEDQYAILDSVETQGAVFNNPLFYSELCVNAYNLLQRALKA